MTDSSEEQNKNDEIREQILKYLYDKRKNARGLSSAYKKISDIKKDLKDLGLNYKEVIDNFLYLIQTGWIDVKHKDYIVRRGGKEIQAGSEAYALSDKGVDHFEGVSKFQKQHQVTGINVTNIQGVTVVGDNNFVRTKFSDLYSMLDVLSEEIRKSDKFSDDEKLSYYSDLETIKDQLAKPKPNKTIINEAWSALSKLASIGGTFSLIDKIANIICSIL